MRKRIPDLLKYALYGFLMCALGFCAAVYLYTPGEEISAVLAVNTEKQAYTAAQFRTERQQLRSMQKAQLNEIIYNSQSDPETLATAQKQLLDLLEREEMENLLEGMLEIRGFNDAVVSIRQNSATVLIQSEALTRQESSIILELVCRETGLLGGDIKIIPIK